MTIKQILVAMAAALALIATYDYLGTEWALRASVVALVLLVALLDRKMSRAQTLEAMIADLLRAQNDRETERFLLREQDRTPLKSHYETLDRKLESFSPEPDPQANVPVIPVPTHTLRRATQQKLHEFVTWHDALIRSLAEHEITVGFPQMSEEIEAWGSPDDQRVDREHPCYGVLHAKGEYGPSGPMFGDVAMPSFVYQDVTDGTLTKETFYLGFRRTRERVNFSESETPRDQTDGRLYYIYEFYRAWKVPIPH